MKIPFGLTAYQSRSLPVNAQELVNLYPERQPDHSKDFLVTHGTPGTLLDVTCGTGPIHGMKVMNNVLYVVSGENFYSVTTDGTVTLIGPYTGNVRVMMETNTDELIIVNGIRAALYDTTNGLRIINDADFYQTDRVVFLEGRFYGYIPDTFSVFGSDSFDGFNWDGLNFVQAKTDPGNIVSLIADHAEIWIFKAKSAEVWSYNRDESSLPISKIEGAHIEKGCAAKHSPAKLDNTMYWLGDDLSVYREDGYRPANISTHAIEYSIKNYTTTSDAFGWAYEDEGHAFYVLTFPSEGDTWVYDASQLDPNIAWHKRGYKGGRYRANCYEYFNGKHLIGDFESGKVLKMDLDTYKDENEEIIRKASSPVIHNGRKRIFMDRLEVDIESGTGLITGQGSNPQAMLKYSDDGGRTWSSEQWRDMGEIGQYKRRVIWRQLGSFYERIFKLVISDPVKTVIIDAHAQVETE